MRGCRARALLFGLGYPSSHVVSLTASVPFHLIVQLSESKHKVHLFQIILPTSVKAHAVSLLAKRSKSSMLFFFSL
jgi:hypothetical protein